MLACGTPILPSPSLLRPLVVGQRTGGEGRRGGRDTVAYRAAGDNGRRDSWGPEADEGDVGWRLSGREPAELGAAARHPADMHCRRAHPRARLHASPASAAARYRRDHRELF